MAPQPRREPRAWVQVGPDRWEVTARRATGSEVERLWPRLVELWPAYVDHLAATGDRHVFLLEPGRPPRRAHRPR